MGEFDALAAEIYKDKVRRARLASPEEKLRDGLELWEVVLGLMKAGVLFRHPEANETQQLEILRQQLNRLGRMHEKGVYFPLPVSS